MMIRKVWVRAKAAPPFLVDAGGGGRMGAGRFFQHDARVRRGDRRRRHVGGRGDIEAGRGRQKPDPRLLIPIGDPALEGPEVLHPRGVDLLEIQAGGKLRPAWLVEIAPREMLAAVSGSALDVL